MPPAQSQSIDDRDDWSSSNIGAALVPKRAQPRSQLVLPRTPSLRSGPARAQALWCAGEHRHIRYFPEWTGDKRQPYANTIMVAQLPPPTLPCLQGGNGMRAWRRVARVRCFRLPQVQHQVSRSPHNA